MALIIESHTIDFPSRTGERNINFRVTFLKPIVKAWVALAGYEAQYTNGDHHVKRLTVMLSCTLGARTDEGWEVNVNARFNLRDKNADDPFQGKINFVIFAEPQGRIIPPVEI